MKSNYCIKTDSKLSSLYTPSVSSTGTHVLPNGLGLDLKNETPVWYTTWLIAQSDTFPPRTFDIFHTSHEHCTPESHWDLFTRIVIQVGETVTHDKATTIDKIIGRLLDEGILAPMSSAENLNYARYFVFAILSYQTMLYSPSPLGPASPVPRQLRITEHPGCCMFTHASHAQDIEECAGEILSELFMGFGVLLPSKNLCLDDEQHMNQSFHQQVEVDAKQFNAYALHHVAGIKVKWTDSLSCHLEFNSVTKELLLFRFPSFCRFTLAEYDQGKGRGVLHACATTSRLRCQWATEAEINQFLVEVLLSYRLLFGQTKRSRGLFRSIDPFLRSKEANRNMRDPLLSSLCGARSWDDLLLDLRRDWELTQKETYYLPRDFPILRYRFVVLQRHLSASAPRTWIQLWRDKRDSAHWMTFWAVISFGAFGSLMALLQVLMQAVQMLQ
ncbi:hypothetical protein N7524_011063 [Penicillium chrysogenum]|nr:hypothetical protein N7524_011063 [Penicillium chrysogenum]